MGSPAHIAARWRRAGWRPRRDRGRVRCQRATTRPGGSGPTRVRSCSPSPATTAGCRTRSRCTSSRSSGSPDGTLRIDIIDDWRQGEPDRRVGLIEDVAGGQGRHGLGRSAGVRRGRGDELPGAGRPVPRRQLRPAGQGVRCGDPRADAGTPRRDRSHRHRRPPRTDAQDDGRLPPLHRRPSTSRARSSARPAGPWPSGRSTPSAATPTMVPAESTLDGLDGLDYQLDGDLRATTTTRMPRYVTANVDLWPRPLVIFMDADRFAGLTPDAAGDPAHRRGQLDRAGARRRHATRRPKLVAGCAWRAWTVVEASDADVARSRHGRRAGLRRARGRPGDEGVPRRDPGAEGAGRPRRPSPSPARPEPPLTRHRSTPIDGVYRGHHHPGRQSRRSRPCPGELRGVDLRVRSGPVRVHAGGRPGLRLGLRDVRRRRAIASSGRSSTAAGSPRTMRCNKPGERFVFGWSLYRDTLTLTAVPGEISPENFMVKPWHRTGSAPSPQVFGTRCPPPSDALWPSS